jgi:hypothetical protein
MPKSLAQKCCSRIVRAGWKVSRRRLPEFIGGDPAMIALLQNIEQR